MDPLTFAFERFGRFITPDSRTGWLSKPGLLLKDSAKCKAGDRNKGIGGTSICISDTQVLVFGPDYREHGFPAAGDTSAATPHFWRSLMQPATERWMMLTYSNSATPFSALHLNHPDDALLCAYSGEEKRLVRVRHAVLSDVARRMNACGIKGKSAIGLIHLANDVLSEYVDLPASRRTKYEQALEQCPDLPFLAQQLARADVPPIMVGKFYDLFLQE